MVRKPVASYGAFENIGAAVDLVVYYADGTASTIAAIGGDEADYLIDLLRHERPISYDAETRRLSTREPEPVGEAEVTPDLDAWLTAHAAIAGAIVWDDGSAHAWPHWTAARKQALREAFVAAWNRGQIALVDPPPNQVVPADDEHATTVLSAGDAWALYRAHVGHALAVELGEWVRWSITGYGAPELTLLFDGREMFHRRPDGSYQIEESKGRAVPAPPAVGFAFLGTHDLIGATRLDTIARLLDWCRAELHHFSGGADAQNMEDQWQYRGYPPVTRVIAGTPFTGHPERGVEHRTAGCRGTTGFLRTLLRLVNIPVRQEHRCGHALPAFPSEGRYLTHGDDPYNQLAKATPPFPAVELLIDQARWDAWFGAGVADAATCDNVGRQTRTLAVTYLPNYLLHARCADQAAGVSHANSSVFETLRGAFTLAELEAGDLWGRLDAKIASFGGCAHVP